MSVNLFTALFYLLLFLLMCGTLCGHVSVTDGAQASDSNSVELFKKAGGINEIIIKFKPDGEQAASEGEKKVTVKNYYSPAIVTAGDYFILLAGVDRIAKSGEKNNNIVTTYIQSVKLLSSQKFAEISDWETQFAVNNEAVENTVDVVKGLLAVAKNNETYLLFVNFSKKTLAGSATALDLKFGVVVRTVKDGNTAGKKIEWIEKKLTFTRVSKKLENEFKEQEDLANYHFSGSAFLADKGKIVFSFVIKNSKEKMSALIYLNDQNAEPESVDTKIAEDCYPYFFPWNTKIIMVPVDCAEAKKKPIMELSDSGQKWKESTEQFLKHSDFFQDKRDFVTVKNGLKEILLFTVQKPQPAESPNDNGVYLWMSDGTRLKKIKKKIADVGEKITPISFLFAEGKLFSLNQKLESSGSKIETENVKLTYLEEQSTEITDTISAWSNTDAEISRLCEQKGTFKIPCLTNGLVGFLSGAEDSSDDNEWKDKYLFKDVVATPTGSEDERKTRKVPHGFKFSEDGGVKWEVGSANNDQQYSFINLGFTLVATVKINDITEVNAHNSVLGVVFQQLPVGTTTANNIIGLLCDAEKKWTVGNKAKVPLIKIDKGCVVGKTYSVALVLREQKLEIYVDGEQLTLPNEVQINKENKIDYFYFGANKGTPSLGSTAVTITNVLLYNRPLKEEIKKLNPEHIKVDTKAQPGSDSINQQTPEENTDKTGTQPDTSATQTPTKNEAKEVQPSSPPPPTTEDSAVRVSVVGVLCFMLFGVFTSLGRYVY